MASFKTIIVVATAFLVASCSGTEINTRITDSHNINQCDVTNADDVLLETNIYEPAKLLTPVVFRTINYPETGINSKVITCLKVINMDTSNHGGYPEIVSGGVGSTDVQIRLVSQLGQPLNFRIEIWAATDTTTVSTPQG